MNFIWKKIKRLGFYWIFCVFIVIPFFNSKQIQLTGNYFNYWIGSLMSFQDARVGPLASGQPNNMHFWYISLLLYVYILVGVIYKITEIFHGKESINSPNREMTLPDLLWFGLLTLAADFVFLIYVPDANWVIVPNVIQFNINQLPILILYFGFGLYARHKGWYTKDHLPLKLHSWISISIILSFVYFLIGQEFFANIAVSSTLSPIYLFGISLVRSFLLLAYLMTAMALAGKYFFKKHTVLNELANVSYEIYLVHMFIVVILQMLFAGFGSVPVIVKIPAIFLVSTGVCFLLGKYTLRKFPRISAVIMIVLFLVMPILFGPD